MDLLLGDPVKLPHPIVWFGKIIGYCERRFNHGKSRRLKGGLTAISLIVGIYLTTWLLLDVISPYVWLSVAVQAILIFYCLAGTTLIKEVKMVFQAVDISLERGRIQVGRIVGRDTANLSAQEIRTAALETLAENLSQLVQKIERGEKDIYQDYISFCRYNGKVVPSIRRRRMVEYHVLMEN